MLVILVNHSTLLVMSMIVVMVMGMTVSHVPMAVLVIMIDHRCRGLAPQTSATLTHMNLHEPLRTGV